MSNWCNLTTTVSGGSVETVSGGGKGTALMNFLYIIAARSTNALCAATGEAEFTSEAELAAIRGKKVSTFQC